MPRKKILWLCSWYPSEIDPFNGDFIQRHAKAASLYNNIHVIHVTPVTDNRPVPGRSRNQIGNLSEEIIYFRKGLSLYGRWAAHWRLLRLYEEAIEEFLSREGKPSLIHVHIPIWAGVMAVRLKRKFGIPFLVTEHWGIYNSVEKNNYRTKNQRFRRWSKKIILDASILLSPSQYLVDGINNMVCEKESVVIRNTVDTTLFNYADSNRAALRFLHVSNMVPLKNVPGILNAFNRLHSANPAAELVLVGNKDNAMADHARSIGLTPSNVKFTGEISYPAVAEEMKKADCLVLFSDIENSPCVIGEALCCGLPVIATRVGGIPELVNDSNSILIERRDEAALSTAMKAVIEKSKVFDRSSISAASIPMFSFDTIGKEMDRVYDRFL